jgi:hypothetical protein
MTSDTPDWIWLEKGLADRVTTDLFQSREVDLMARDRMQELAEKMAWVPEMMEDPRQIKKIGRSAGYVISGTHSPQVRAGLGPGRRRGLQGAATGVRHGCTSMLLGTCVKRPWHRAGRWE